MASTEVVLVLQEPLGEPIADYNVPLDVEGVDGTQDSTARTTFPKVSFSLLQYMHVGNIQHDDDQDDELLGSGDDE